MNREQKAATIEALAGEIDGAEAVFAVDYRGITVSQAAELRTKLRDADATFQVVKNSLTERAADQVGAESLKDLLSGPTALTFVRGDAALAAKAVADQARATQLLPFKGGLMNGEVLDADQIRSISRLPSREVLYGQLVGIVASPISGLVRTLGGLVGGLAVALSQVREKKESGEIPAGAPPAAEESQAGGASAVEESQAEGASAVEPGAGGAPAAEEPESGEPDAQEQSAAAEPPVADEAPPEGSSVAAAGEATEKDSSRAHEESAETIEAPADGALSADQAEPASEPAQDDNKTDASAHAQEGTGETESAEATKED
jgi:large subunit ribosomal protein L10